MRNTRRQAPRRLDWQDIHARLERASAAAEAPSPERARAILERRARELARAPESLPSPAEVLEVVRFTLADDRYALETRHIREVVRLTDVTPVPGAPESLLGVVNLRGEVLALFDLRRIFGIPADRLEPRARVLVLGGDRAEFGILAEEVHELQRLPREALLEPPASISDVGRELLQGVTAGALAVLDGALLLRDARFHIDLREKA